jgi:hypothetical protein
VNETRAQFAYSSLAAPPTDPVGPAVSISGIASFGTLSGSPTGRLNKLFEVVDNLSHQAGAHALRAGVDVLYNDDLITFPRSNRGAYTFSSLATFLESEPGRLRAGRVEGRAAADAESRRPLRPAMAEDDCHRHEQCVAARGVCVDAVG